MKGCTAAIMRMWLSTESERLPMRPQGLAQSKTGRCSAFRCGAPSSAMAPQTCRLAASISGRAKPMALSRSKSGASIAASSSLSTSRQNSTPSVHLLNTKRMSKADFERALDRRDLLVAEAFRAQRAVAERIGALERAVADGIGDDVVDLALVVAERRQRFRDAAVDDLEIAAAGELLELDQREIGLDAGGVAVHHQADRAGRRDDGGLGVAVAEILAHRERVVPGLLRRLGEVGLHDGFEVERHGVGRELLIARLFAMRRAAMVAHHPQHRVLVGGVFGEGAELARHLRRGRVGDAGHHRRDGAGDGAAPRASRRGCPQPSAGRRYWRSRGPSVR